MMSPIAQAMRFSSCRFSRLKLTGTDFDRKVQYQLLLQDDEDGIELARYPVTIDLAIQNDFGF